MDETTAFEELQKRRQAELAARGWPWPLVKSAFDPFDYAVGLRDGSVVRYEHADTTESEEWVTLIEPKIVAAGALLRGATEAGFTFERGLVVRLSEIAWASDGPVGS